MNHPNSYSFSINIYGKTMQAIAFPYFTNEKFGSLGLEILHEHAHLLKRVVFSNVVFSGNLRHKIDTYIPSKNILQLENNERMFNGMEEKVVRKCIETLRYDLC